MKQVSKSVISIMIAVLLLAFSSVSVFAAESPSASPEIKVEVIPTEGGTGSYEFESDFGQGENGGTIVHFEPKPNDGYTFSHWELEGQYTIIEGSLNSGSFTIEAFSDIKATPYYTKNGSSGSSAGGSTNVPADTNNSGTSPQTGDSNLLFVAGAVVVLSTFGALAVRRRLVKIEK